MSCAATFHVPPTPAQRRKRVRGSRAKEMGLGEGRAPSTQYSRKAWVPGGMKAFNRGGLQPPHPAVHDLGDPQKPWLLLN